MTQRRRPARPRFRFGSRRAAAFTASAAAALALALQTDRGIDRLGASKRLRAVEVMSQQVARSGRASGPMIANHIRLLQEARRLDPSEVGVLVALGGQYMLLGQPERAIAVYREAQALEPRPETYLNLGQALLASGRRNEAREAYEKAVRLAPRLAARVPEDQRPVPRR